jgi:hypothetical protein
MARTFQNPANNHNESVGMGSSAGAFFFGPIYLVYKGLWAHAFIWLLVVILPAALSGEPIFIFTGPAASLFYGLGIQQILAGRYLRQGWKEVTSGPSFDTQELAVTTAALLSTPDPRLPRAKPVPASTAGPTKICPFCAEEVKAAAVKCKHCQSELRSSQPVTSPSSS